MRRLTALLLTLVLGVALGQFTLASPAVAGESCHKIRAKGTGYELASRPGDPPFLVRTVAQLTGGGLLQGTTEAEFVVTGVVPGGFAFAGPLVVSANRGTLTVDLTGTVDATTGEFEASGPVGDGTGKLAGATGSLAFAGAGVHEGDLPPGTTGAFTETVRGTICVDLGGNGRRR